METRKILDYFIKTEKNNWEVVIGSRGSCPGYFTVKTISLAHLQNLDAKPNTQVSLVDCSISRNASSYKSILYQNKPLKLALGLNAKINLHSIFDQKKLFLC